MIFCTRKDCPQPGHMNHYHCGVCTDPEITSMLGHYSADAQGKETFTCKEEYKKVEIGIPMTLNGTEGRFLTDEEYEELADKDTPADEYLEELEIEVHNHRHMLDEARSTAYGLYKFLDNAL